MGKKKTHEEFISEMKQKNENINIVGVYITSKTPIKCVCKKCGYEWVSEPRRLSSGQGCPQCAGNKRKTHKEFVDGLKDINPYLTILGEYSSLENKILTQCNKCFHVWEAKALSLWQGHGCPVCGNKNAATKRRKTHDKFIRDLLKINTEVEVIGLYQKSSSPIKCKCKICNSTWSVRPNNLLNGQKCPHCHRITHDVFVKIMSERHPEIKVIGEYTDLKTKILCSCLLCQRDFYLRPDKYMYDGDVVGCPKCSIANGNMKRVKKHDVFAMEMHQKNQDVIFYENYKRASTKIKCGCRKCGNIWYALPSKLLYGCGCPCCASSKGEKSIKHFLTANNIKFETQKKFTNLKGDGNRELSYDFFVQEHNLLIEYQGIQHEKPIDFFGGEEQFKIQQEHDKRKREYAKEHNIDLLEIWYYDFENIEKILAIKLGGCYL